MTQCRYMGKTGGGIVRESIPVMGDDGVTLEWNGCELKLFAGHLSVMQGRTVLACLKLSPRYARIMRRWADKP